MVPGTRLYSLYASLPLSIQNLFVSGYGYVLHRRRYGAEHDAILERITESKNWDRERIERAEWETTLQTVRYAYQHVPYYRRTWANLGFHPGDLKDWNDFQRLPITEKDAVKDDPWDFVADPMRHAKGLLRGTTSGTTGKPLQTIKTRSVHQAVWAFQERQRHLWGLHKESPRATIHNRLIVPVGQTRPPFWRYNWIEKQWLFSNLHLHEQYLDSYLEKLGSLGIEELNGYPSAIATIATHAVRRGYDRIRPRAVITLAETVYEQQRQIIQEAFECPVADQYGSAEVVVLLGQCPAGTYHVNHEFGHFETVRGNENVIGEPGDVVGTGFINKTQVLVRYRLGDQAILSTNPSRCACGWETAHVQGIVGRIDDVFYLPDGRALGRLDLVAKGLPGVRESQLVQDEIDHIMVRLVPLDRPTELAEKIAEDRLRGFVGTDMRIGFEWRDEIPRSRAGKFRFQINQVGRPETSKQRSSGSR
jgi:phenylacetate-CoA ligase